MLFIFNSYYGSKTFHSCAHTLTNHSKSDSLVIKCSIMWVSSSLTFLDASVGRYDLRFKNSLNDFAFWFTSYTYVLDSFDSFMTSQKRAKRNHLEHSAICNSNYVSWIYFSSHYNRLSRWNTVSRV